MLATLFKSTITTDVWVAINKMPLNQSQCMR